MCTETNNEMFTPSVSLLVGGREDIGCGWRAVEGASRELYDDDDDDGDDGDDVMRANILNFTTTHATSRCCQLSAQAMVSALLLITALVTGH